MTATAVPPAPVSKWLVLTTAVVGVFLSLLDATSVNTALPTLQRLFHTDLRTISYVATTYQLAAGVTVCAAAYFAQRFSLKRSYLTALALFTLCSLLCGLAWSAPSLIFFRILQGAGGACLFPLSLSLIFSVFPPEERGQANALFGIPVLAAPALGPLLGGWLVQDFSWRWIFMVNIPIGIAGVLLGWRVLHQVNTEPNLRFDTRGFLLLGSALGLLLYGLSNLAYDGLKNTLSVSGPLLLSLLLLAVYVPTSLRTTKPLLDLRLYLNRNFWVGNVTLWLGTIGLFGAAFLLPQYFQTLRDLSPLPAGALLLAQGLASIVATILIGRFYTRLDPRWVIATGVAIMAVDTLLIGHYTTLSTPFWLFIPLLALRGLSLPAITQTANTAALQDFQGASIPGASTLIVVTRNVVTALAIALLTNLLQARTAVHTMDLNLCRVQMSQTALCPEARAHAFQDTYTLTALLLVPAVFLPFLLSAPRRRIVVPAREA